MARLINWFEQAACVGLEPDAWFPNEQADAETPIRVCRSCPVMLQCLVYAVETRQRHGVWGGQRMETYRPKNVGVKRFVLKSL
jgi:WhiB family redox-sensing transcriptional regulator